MAQSPGPGQEPPTGRRLARSVVIAAVAAAVALVAFVLPAEYGIDPLGIGGALGLTALSEQQGTRTFEIVDVVGGNEQVVQVEVPDFGEPVPLTNPAVHQAEPAAARTETFNIEIPAERETEVKLVLATGKAALYSWHVDRGTIYSDFHGHTPDAGPNFFVRYFEHQEGAGGSGSLVAPFDGEHGWYWLNYNDFPVTVTLTVSGYYDDIIEYGLF